MVRRIAHLLVPVCLVFALAVAVQISSLSPASAVDVTPGSSGHGTPGDKDNDDNDDSDHSSGGGGGFQSGWSKSTTLWNNSSWTRSVYWTYKAPKPCFEKGCGPVVKELQKECTGSNKWGPILGVTVNRGGNVHSGIQTIEEHGEPAYDQTYVNFVCIDSPHFEDIPVECAYSVGAIGYGPSGNPRVSSSTKTFATVKTPFAKGGQKNLEQCPEGFKQTFSWNPVEFGKYRLKGTGKAVTCTVRHYTTPNAKTGKWPADYIRSCGSPHAQSVVEVKWQQWCDGFSMGWSGSHKFTEEECGDGYETEKEFKWSCNIDDSNVPWLSGIKNSAAITVFHDAKKRSLIWKKQPKLTGKVSSVTNKKVYLKYVSGTPFREGVSASAATQHFESTPKIGAKQTGWKAAGTGTQTRFDLKFYKAGLPGENLKLVPVYLFTGKFATLQTTITSVNWETGKVTTKDTTKYTTKDSSCTGNPTNLAVTRARVAN